MLVEWEMYLWSVCWSVCWREVMVCVCWREVMDCDGREEGNRGKEGK